MRTALTANTTFNVDPVKGSDDNDGITAPWKTLTHAYQTIQGSYDLSGFSVILKCAKGIYKSGLAATGPLFGGSGQPTDFQLVGAGTDRNFADCLIEPTDAGDSCLYLSYGAKINLVSGFMLSGFKNSQDLVDLAVGSTLQIGTLNGPGGDAPPVMCFGPAINPSNHVTITGFSVLTVYQNYSIFNQGEAPQCHIDADSGFCYYNTNGQSGLITVYIVDATPFVDSFVHCSFSNLNIQAVAWACEGGALQGMRTCIVDKNGIVDTGSGNSNYFPGTLAPLTERGGIYL